MRESYDEGNLTRQVSWDGFHRPFPGPLPLHLFVNSSTGTQTLVVGEEVLYIEPFSRSNLYPGGGTEEATGMDGSLAPSKPDPKISARDFFTTMFIECKQGPRFTLSTYFFPGTPPHTASQLRS